MFDPDTSASLKLLTILHKLKVAGMAKRSISLAAAIAGSYKPSKYCFKFAIVSTNIEYAICVPYADRDQSLTP